jgi:hypothetical protein
MPYEHTRARAPVEDLLRPPVSSLVSARRQLATVLMAAHALRELPQGDLVETGVFQGGTTVLMARVIHNLSSPRVLYACDSFLGLPRAQSQDRESKGCTEGGDPPRRSCMRGTMGTFKSPRTHVEHVLHREGLMHHVRIVSGWFHQSLPPRGLRSISMLRLDGDTFNGTYEALRWLYPLVMDGGIVYLDDVGSFKGAHAAMTGYFGHSMGTRILEDDGHYYEALWWRKGIVQEWLSF